MLKFKQNSTTTGEASTLHSRSIRLMGNMFNISVVAEDAAFAAHCMDEAVKEIERIEALLTTFKEDSQANMINRDAGRKPVQVDREVFDLIERSIRVSDVTQGAFDITYGSIDKKLWNFDVNMTALPDADTARRMVRLINYKNIILSDRDGSVMLKHPGMRIGFGGIGKGYAADRAKKILLDLGISSGIVNASGDLTGWGSHPNGGPWTVGIADPNANAPFSYLPLSNMSVATSGNYEKYVIIKERRYSHTINPKTGLPVSGIKSVSIISPFAELSDAMATPVTVMGIKAGLGMINQMSQIACIIIDDDNRVYTSGNVSLH
jgi:thiamine biosynthesis lipoprotein